MRRDPNLMLGGASYALTVILAIRPGREVELRDRLVAWGTSPFARLETTHFARLVVLDRMVFEGPDRERPLFPYQYLLFSATFDGESSEARDEYLERMCRRIPELEDVFGFCIGAPFPLAANPALFREWIVAHQYDVSAFFAHRPRARVADIRAALTLRRRIRRFAFRMAYRRPDELQRSFEQAFPR